ncbi:MAG TPA: hypothetical protein VK550_31500 [Polyangiaceae bacterium]|nr:hypothetical protein [Polyangiaceae bacterium]
MRSRQFVGIVVLGATTALGAGCVAHAQAGGYTDVDAPVVFTGEPTLVAIEPDVWVVRDYDHSVYYVDGNYWVNRRDRWYRSPSYDSGWVVVEPSVVPRTLVARDHSAYVHYRGAANAQTRKAPRERTAAAPDHDRRGPGQSGESHDHRSDDKEKGPEHSAGPHDGPPGQAGRPEVGNHGRGNGDDDRKRDEAKRENERKKEDDKKNDKKKNNQ